MRLLVGRASGIAREAAVVFDFFRRKWLEGCFRISCEAPLPAAGPDFWRNSAAVVFDFLISRSQILSDSSGRFGRNSSVDKIEDFRELSVRRIGHGCFPKKDSHAE